MYQKGTLVRNVYTQEVKRIERVDLVPVTGWADVQPVYVLSGDSRWNEEWLRKCWTVED